MSGKGSSKVRDSNITDISESGCLDTEHASDTAVIVRGRADLFAAAHRDSEEFSVSHETTRTVRIRMPNGDYMFHNDTVGGLLHTNRDGVLQMETFYVTNNNTGEMLLYCRISHTARRETRILSYRTDVHDGSPVQFKPSIKAPVTSNNLPNGQYFIKEDDGNKTRFRAIPKDSCFYLYYDYNKLGKGLILKRLDDCDNLPAIPNGFLFEVYPLRSILYRIRAALPCFDSPSDDIELPPSHGRHRPTMTQPADI